MHPLGPYVPRLFQLSIEIILMEPLLLQGPRDASGAQSSGSVLCFDGASAAAAAKIPQPLDLLVVAARLDAGSAFLLSFCVHDLQLLKARNLSGTEDLKHSPSSERQRSMLSHAYSLRAFKQYTSRGICAHG